MEIYRSLYLRGDGEQLASLMSQVKGSLSSGWSINQEPSPLDRWSAGLGSEPDSFRFDGNHQLPAATLHATKTAAGFIEVSNIIPIANQRLSLDEYNAILEAFFEAFVAPAAAEFDVEAVLTDDKADLSIWLSDVASGKLRHFSATANKGTGAAHPTDQERWMDFVLAAHREGSSLDAMMLRRWLIEEGGWFPEIADRLALEYDFGREILHHAESRVGAA